MKFLGYEFTRAVAESAKAADPTAGGASIDVIMSRLHAAYDTVSGISVTPENCMRSPTVQAIVQAVSRRISTLPIQVLRAKIGEKGRTIKETQPQHPTSKLLQQPDENKTQVNYWLDASSSMVRYGRFCAYKNQGNTGPIRRLTSLDTACVNVEQNQDSSLLFRYQNVGGRQEYTKAEIHYVRGPARNGYLGDSPVEDMRETIGLEIAAERMGASFFGNGAMPFLIFKFIEGSKGFKTDEDAKQFITDFQQAYGDRRRFKALSLPAGMDVADPVAAENNKAQFLETRKHQRTVIAGAWGVPPHLVGDLTSGTFNNVEQQSLDFIQAVVYPYIRMFESAMEIDLLTPIDRAGGVIIRFNLDAALRGDFQTRQTGLQTQRRNGIINANEWRERENMNPISDADGGEEYWVESGVTIAGDEPIAGGLPLKPKPTKKPAAPSVPVTEE